MKADDALGIEFDYVTMPTKTNHPKIKPSCVVIDTNIWRAELLLKTPRGHSLVYMLGRQGGVIGLPEVVEREIPKQIVKLGAEIVQKCDSHLRRLIILDDNSHFSDMPDSYRLEDIVEKRLAELEPIIVKIPFTLEHAKAALQLIYDDLPPNSSGNQQFKDSAIWQAVLDLSRQYRVHFVTNDRAFFADSNNFKKGLAENLKTSCRKARTEVYIYNDLKSCLDVVGRELDNIDKERIFSLIYPEIELSIKNRVQKYGCELGPIRNKKVSAYPSSDTDKVVIEFSISMTVLKGSKGTDSELTQGQLFVIGNCYYINTRNQIADLSVDIIELRLEYRSEYTVRHSFSVDNGNVNPFPKPMDSIYQEIDALEI